jgi:hypothetical protein
MTSSARCNMTSAARDMISRRAVGAMDDQAGNAEAATLAAWRASATVAAGTRVTTSPETGFARSRYRPSDMTAACALIDA